MVLSVLLTALTGPKRGFRLELSSGTWLVGRGPDAQAGQGVVDLSEFDSDEKVSHRHAQLVIRENDVLLEDLGSTNGTFVNDNDPLVPSSPRRLESGDVIVFGMVGFRLEILGQVHS